MNDAVEWRAIVVIALGVLVAGAGYGMRQLPMFGAGGLLHPARRYASTPPPASCDEVRFSGAGVMLHGWRCGASGMPRGTVVYLHGIADNRASAIGVIERFRGRGFDVLAYDTRAHGESEGEACTYGLFEKHDLRRVLDTARPGAIVLIGTSLGAAVALQAAAQDARITAVVAAETFSDLRAVVADRAPFFFTRTAIARAFELAAREGHFDVDAAARSRRPPPLLRPPTPRPRRRTLAVSSTHCAGRSA